MESGVSSFRAFLDEEERLNASEISMASIVAIALACVASYAHHHKWLSRAGHLLRVSSRTGDEDVWDFFHTMPSTDWVFVRDHKLDLVYFGWIRAFSDTHRERELVMGDVDVYTNTVPVRKLYSCPIVYISRDRYDLTIEVVAQDAGANRNHDSSSELNQ